MKVLIAILSCHVLRGYEQSLRDTWIKEIPEGVDYRFFLGSPNLDYILPDEVLLDVDDSFQGITKKTVALYTWALAQGYDFVFKCDLDTLVRPALLIQCGFEKYDYTGGQNSFFASGGAGYILSRRSMQAVVNYPISTGPEEDVHTARALLAQGIQLHADPRFKFYPGATLNQNTITYHLGSVKGWSIKATPEEMRQAHAGTFTLVKPSVYSRRLRR